MIEEDAPQQKKKKKLAVVYLDLWVYVEKNCTFDLVCRIFGWLEFGGNEKKEEPLPRAQWDSPFGLFAIGEEGVQSEAKFFSFKMVIVFFFFFFFS